VGAALLKAEATLQVAAAEAKLAEVLMEVNGNVSGRAFFCSNIVLLAISGLPNVTEISGLAVSELSKK
jgi:hypothetical protein